MKWFSGKEEFFDNLVDPHQMRNVAGSDTPTLNALREALKALLADAHDDFMAGPAYASWYDAERNVAKTRLGPVSI